MKTKGIRRIAGIAAVLLLTAAAAAAYHYKNDKTKIFSRAEEKSFLPRFNPESVTGIEIEMPDRKLVMKAQDGVWTLPGWEDAPASRQEIIRLLTGLSKAVPLREIRGAEDETLLRKLSLSTEKGLLPGIGEGRGAGIRLAVSDKDGEIFHLILGLAHERKSRAMTLAAGTGQKEYDGRYVRLDGKDGVPHVYLVSRVFENCLPYSSRWHEPLMLDPDAVQSGIDRLQYEETGPDGKLKTVWLVLPDPALRMFILAVPADAALSQSLLTKYIETVIKPFSRNVLSSKEAEKFRFTGKLTIVCHNGLVCTIELARRQESGEAAARMHLAFHPARFPRRTGESAEDHAGRIREQTFKVDQFNKNFSGRTYLIRPDLPDLLSAVPQESREKAKKNEEP